MPSPAVPVQACDGPGVQQQLPWPYQARNPQGLGCFSSLAAEWYEPNSWSTGFCRSKAGGLMPLLEWLCLGCRDVVSSYARLHKAVQRGSPKGPARSGRRGQLWSQSLHYPSDGHFALLGPWCQRTGPSSCAHPLAGFLGHPHTPFAALAGVSVLALQKEQLRAPALGDPSVPCCRGKQPHGVPSPQSTCCCRLALLPAARAPLAVEVPGGS